MRRAVIVGVLLGWSGLAAADNKAAAEAAYNAGQQRYAAGDYLVAADKFEAAFALDPDPVYLFNIAQAYRFGNACAKAAAAYRKFLGAVANPPNADKVQQYIQQVDECAQKQAAAERPTPPPPDPIVQPPPPQPEKPRVPGRGQRIAGLSLFAGGVVMLGVGGFYTRKGSQLRDEREALCADEIRTMGMCQWTPTREAAEIDLEDRGDRANLISYIGWGVGGAAVIGGVLLYVLAPDATTEQRGVSIVPTTDGAMAYGTFRF